MQDLRSAAVALPMKRTPLTHSKIQQRRVGASVAIRLTPSTAARAHVLIFWLMLLASKRIVRVRAAAPFKETLHGPLVPVESQVVSHIEQIQGSRSRSVGSVKRWEELFA